MSGQTGQSTNAKKLMSQSQLETKTCRPHKARENM